MPNDIVYEDIFDYEKIKQQNQELIAKFVSDPETEVRLVEILNEYTSPIIQMSNHSFTEVNIKIARLIRELYLYLSTRATTNEEFAKYFLLIKTISDIVKAQYSRSVGGAERSKVYGSLKVNSKPMYDKDEEDIYSNVR